MVNLLDIIRHIFFAGKEPHTKEKTHQCTICKKFLSSDSHLKANERIIQAKSLIYVPFVVMILLKYITESLITVHILVKNLTNVLFEESCFVKHLI